MSATRRGERGAGFVYPRLTLVFECPCSTGCRGYDRDACSMAGVIAEVPQSILACPSGTYLLRREDGDRKVAAHEAG